jgi:hypothetical protein
VRFGADPLGDSPSARKNVLAAARRADKRPCMAATASGRSAGILIAGDPHRCSNPSFAALRRLKS